MSPTLLSPTNKLSNLGMVHKSFSQLSMIKTMLVLSLASIFVSAGMDEELVSILQPVCKPMGPCVELEGNTGFKQRFECREEVNTTSNEMISRVRFSPCEPPSLLDVLGFNFMMFVGAVLAFLIVRHRKELARQNLVAIVNRA